MTFQEHINTCTFQELIPLLLKLYDERNHTASFKMVFDELRLRKAVVSPVKIHIYLNKWDDDEPEYIAVDCIDPDKPDELYSFASYPWDESLGMEVFPEEDVHLSNAEIAAHCLWEMTFYGFSENQINDRIKQFEHPLYQIEKEEAAAIRRLEDKEVKLYKPHYHNKKILWNNRWKGPMNRSKKKRAYRWEKRIEQLEQISQIKRLIKGLTAHSCIKAEQVNYLFEANHLNEYYYCSYVENLKERAHYIVELITEYPRYDCSKDNRFCLLFNSSSGHEITAEEKEELNKIREILPQEATLIWEYGVDEALKDQIDLLFLGSR